MICMAIHLFLKNTRVLFSAPISDLKWLYRLAHELEYLSSEFCFLRNIFSHRGKQLLEVKFSVMILKLSLQSNLTECSGEM